MSDPGRPPVRATYRLQLHKDFGFAEAARLAPYLGRLGISHAYLSPILKARPGSLHGYDTVDHAEVNPELGGIDGFRDMAAACRAAGIGIILDIVPNHMGIGGSDNPYWLDVLAKGETSRYAHWFDIDWAPAEPGLAGKVLVPFLDRSLEEALASGLLDLRRNVDGNGYSVWIHGHHRLPVAAETHGEAARVLAEGAGLAGLLARQHWRLANASVANDVINYRRFFIISDLAGLRIEDDEVFDAVHRLPFALVAEGLVEGLRVDHVDGLRCPAAYCRKLRAQAPRPVYIVVEKILGEGETLPEDWQVDGTTGYEFAALATPLLVDPAGETALTDFHRRFTGVIADPAEIERAAKLRVMEHELAAELDSLALRLDRLARAERPDGDLTRRALRLALRAFVAAMPVYRTYLADGAPKAADRALLHQAVAEARARNPELEPRAFDFIAAVVTGESHAPAARDVALRIQQFTGPVMAKGLEDTALYRHSRLLALNDVGERPEPFGRPTGDFHAANRARLRRFPHSLLATSTHDSKRGEDTRCRIAALSGQAEAWAAAVPGWVAALEAQGAPAIHPDDAHVVLQQLVGALPTDGQTAGFAERLAGATRKALREARLRSSWIAPDADYEAKVETFIRLALAPGALPASFRSMEEQIGYDGARNGLIETTLKLTVPGVPDIYQGAELWEQSLVDPDNRRPVDFDRRRQLLEQASAPLGDLMSHWQDGAVKLALIARLLAARRRQPQLFGAGSYVPVGGGGPEGARLCAFERRWEAEALFVAVRLYPWRQGGPAAIQLPPPGKDRRWTDLLTPGAALSDSARFDPVLPIIVCGNFG